MSITQNVVGRKLHYNNFPLHHTHDLSGRIGKLIPVQATPVVAGDLFDESIEFNIRFAPLSAPAMARFNVHFHSFYVPYRIITPRNGQESTWERFVMSIGKPLTEVPRLPHFKTHVPELVDNFDGLDNGSFDKEWFMTGSLWDYLHLPVIPRDYADDSVIELSERTLGCPGIIALNFLAYQKIWSDWYRRDQIEKEFVFPNNLEAIYIDSVQDSYYLTPEMPVNSPDEEFNSKDFFAGLMTLRTRNYERDYFTSALPEPQFGDDVTLGGADVIQSLVGARIALNSINTEGVLYTDQASNVASSILGTSRTDPDGRGFVTTGYGNIIEGDAYFSPYTNQKDFNFVGNGAADITGITGGTVVPQFTINELRLAMQLQGVRESINRGGTRYLEIMKSVFGVSVNDLRLQRPQYLGGIKAPISIGAVLQTSASTENSPQGNLTGQGGTVGGNRIFRTKRIFEEAGVVMTIMSITPRTGYFGGIERQYLKHDPIMYYTPAFDHLGEQETYRAELKFHMADSIERNQRNDTLEQDRFFGYNPMYQEYKAAYSTVSGEFRNTLDNWNVFRTFDQIPVLSPEFIHAEPEDFDRIFMFENVENTSNEHFYAQLYFDIKAKRPMSKYSTPVTLF